MSETKCIGVFTSGGDAPGMNAALRAVVRSAINKGFKVKAIYQGYKGMIDGHIETFTSSNVSNIIQQGGTIIKSARSKEFMTVEGRAKAFENLQKEGIDALIAIGGDGTFTGATKLTKEHGIPIIGIPGTIDNDLFGTDFTIGYDTALNTIIEAVDKIRDTATSHERLFFIEVMGRDAGILALNAGIASGAEGVVIPEERTNISAVRDFIDSGFRKSKSSSIILVAEGDETGGAMPLSALVKEEYPEYDVRVTVLGHIQRGGRPTAFDRILASRMGLAAVEALENDQKSVMIGIDNGAMVHVTFNDAINKDQELDLSLLKLSKILAS